MKISQPVFGNSLENSEIKVDNLEKKAISAKASGALKKAEGVAEEFETLFVDMMMKSMRSTAKPEESSNAQEIYQGMLDAEYSKSMTGSHDFGIRSMLLDWMKQNSPELKTDPTALGAQKALKSFEASKASLQKYEMNSLALPKK